MGLVEDMAALRAKIDAGVRASRITVADKLLADELSDDDVVAVTPLFDPWDPDGTYVIGDIRVASDGNPYKCIQGHPAINDPNRAPELYAAGWTALRPIGVAPWVQPPAENPYQIGDRVTHNGQTWESTAANNVWAPGVFGWVVV